MSQTVSAGLSSHWLSEEAFSDACAALPLVSIDLMVTRPGDRGMELLLGLRKNRPAQGYWFTPGGRIFKNEPLDNALHRVARDEICLQLSWLNRAAPLGAWDHFYTDSAFNFDVSTHYVNLPHALHLNADEAQTLTPPIGDGFQHLSWRWMPIVDAKAHPEVHEYVRAVLDLLIESCK